jgi:hypothetical protein
MTPKLFDLENFDPTISYSNYNEDLARAFLAELKEKRYFIEDAFLDWLRSEGVPIGPSYLENYCVFAKHLLGRVGFVRRPTVPLKYGADVNEMTAMLDPDSRLLCLALSIHIANEIEKIFGGTFYLDITSWNERDGNRREPQIAICPPNTAIPVVSAVAGQVERKYFSGKEFASDWCNVADYVSKRQKYAIEGDASVRRWFTMHDPRKKWEKEQKKLAKKKAKLEAKLEGQ